MKLEEEKEKREEYLESIGDVTKQNDLGITYLIVNYYGSLLRYDTEVTKEDNSCDCVIYLILIL